MYNKIISIDDFSRMFRTSVSEIPDSVKELLDSIDTSFHYATQDEVQEYTLEILHQLFEKELKRRDRDENLQAFEKGWMENHEQMVLDGISVEALKPKYFKPDKFQRYNHNLIVKKNRHLEYDLFRVCRDIIFSKYITDGDSIYEFGSGSCQNLYALSEMYPDSKIVGMDWTKASGKIASYLGEKLDRDISGHCFDMLSPDTEYALEPDSVIITIHSLEQLGSNYGALFDYILNSRPKLVVHYEPFSEFFAKDTLLDYLAYIYCKKRNYISGYYANLQELEGKGVLKICDTFRPHLGGILHDSSVVAWKPA